ncbi:GNAT family N-acetyltransferase [Novosphingobium sp.]|uniref:GNAT family N-acetyltransferase n=1 Tax=Novosphingobium sp. TaxID=1874826 RepID=UPI0033416D91
MFMRSERLFLRPAWPEDRADLHDLIGSHALAFVTSAWTARYPRMLITLPDATSAAGGARIIGAVGFGPCDGDAELGVLITREWTNQGFATEAARGALTIARTLGHCRVVAHQFGENPAASRMLAKLGFAPTGHVRNRHSALRGVAEPARIHTLDLCQPACPPLDPAMVRRAA